MKTQAIPHEKKSKAKPADKAAPSRAKRRLARSAANVLAPKTEGTARHVPLLLERCPKPDKKRICFGLYAPEAQAVFVAGSFNGWQPSAMPLQKQDDGRWVVELVLEPGRYEYRFVVDGQWTDDPLSPAYVSNPFGGLNCVLVAAIQGMS
ncbi:MAG: glycogen-binding domain-containing protein [Verrucomicrobiota bacterium]|jgi:5'-AMP-activated protein kinase regulatory beta subunit